MLGGVRLVGLAGLMLITHTSAAAQNVTVDPVLRVAAEGLKVGTRLRITTNMDGVGYGVFVGLQPAGILWEDESGQASGISTADLIELSAGRRTWRKGGVIGAPVGAVYDDRILRELEESGFIDQVYADVRGR